MTLGTSQIDARVEVCIFLLFSRAALYLNQVPRREGCLRKQVSAF